MASKYRLRRIFKPLVKIVAKILSKAGMTANLATWSMLLLAFLSAIFLVLFQHLFLFGLFVFFCGILDGVDGAISRINGTSSSKGGFFDSTMDRISEFIIFTGLLFYFWGHILWKVFDMRVIVIISFIGSIMISYSRARGEIIYNGDYDIGLMARSERLFYIFVTSCIAFFIGFFKEFIVIYMCLVIATAIFRFVKINAQIKNHIKTGNYSETDQ
ncbi:MAG: CDP-alcohol phosphatidyltransferase family protein [Promethearchaeia archaeon]